MLEPGELGPGVRRKQGQTSPKRPGSARQWAKGSSGTKNRPQKTASTEQEKRPRVALMQPAMNQGRMQGLPQPVVQVDGIGHDAGHTAGHDGPGIPPSLRMSGLRGTGIVNGTSFTIPGHVFRTSAQ
jgi:hypothetical protein